MKHLTRYNDVVKFVELVARKKLDDDQLNLIKGILEVTYGDGYLNGFNLAADLVYNEKFKLSPEHFEWFIQVHRRHMKAMGTDNQKKYALPNVRDVKYDKAEDCLKVYYDDIWWHYDKRGCWY